MTRTKLFASIALLAATPALADMSSHSSAMSGITGANNIDNMLRTSEIVGGDIYAIDRDYSDDEWNVTMFEEIHGEWEDIGNITDVVLSKDGKQLGLVVSAGGFLDIGDSTVVLSMDDVRRIGTSDGEIDYVVRMTEEQLKELPDVNEEWF